LVVQLFQNLIGNAIKFAGDRRPEIEITARRLGSDWVIGVKDRGIGIKSEYCEQIFAPFKRLHGMAEYEGSGIGLALCRKIVDHHEGRIWVESSVGRGAHFEFTLAPDFGGVEASSSGLRGDINVLGVSQS
ncbi:MAG: hypothetical protein KDA61_10545, partial [Planctomycetales bacterium]|nr:hypothetical protein [Planctomycetales bacterium]